MPKPLRVAMLARVVYPLHGFGGIERHVFHLTTHLARLGVVVKLYVQTPPSTTSVALALPKIADLPNSLQPTLIHLRYDFTSPFLRPNSILGRTLNYPWYSWQLGQLAAQAVRQGQVDLVHSQGLCAFGYAVLRKRFSELQTTPFIANPHGMEEYRTPDRAKWLAYAPFRALSNFGHRQADRVIATDHCTQADLPKYLGVDSAKVVVIPSAIDVAECLSLVSDELRSKLREQFKLATASPIFFSVGRLEANKGYHILLAALAQIQDILPSTWHWLLVGEGKEANALQQQAQQAGLGRHVTFVGRLTDAELHSLYEEVDIVIHPTLYEGSSLVTLEGMIHRRPIVASAVGGIPDKVFDGQNGYLVKPGEIADLVAKLRIVLAQREQWSNWGKESVRIVQERYAWPVVAQQTKALYHALLPREKLS